MTFARRQDPRLATDAGTSLPNVVAMEPPPSALQSGSSPATSAYWSASISVREAALSIVQETVQVHGHSMCRNSA
jgi:hypothetical protein